jgi:RNA polymerase sigma-70 factor (ECF subfamily)
MRGGFRLFLRLGEKRLATMKQEDPPDPENLLLLARAGEGPALGRLLELYRNYLTLLARTQIGRRLQGKVDASDLVQETFLAAYRDFGSCRATTEKELVSWLRQILAANLTDLVRRYCGAKRRDVRLERQLADELDESSRGLNLEAMARQSSPSAQASRREQAVLLADALESLPADYREVIVLRHLEGLSFLEVARRMDRSVDAVEKLWVRALARLRRVLGVPL